MAEHALRPVSMSRTGPATFPARNRVGVSAAAEKVRNQDGNGRF